MLITMYINIRNDSIWLPSWKPWLGWYLGVEMIVTALKQHISVVRNTAQVSLPVFCFIIHKHGSKIIILIWEVNLSISGKTGSVSTRREIEQNKALFFDTIVSPGYSRKIDLLVKCHEPKEFIEISSNEWKSSNYVRKNTTTYIWDTTDRLYHELSRALRSWSVTRPLGKGLANTYPRPSWNRSTEPPWRKTLMIMNQIQKMFSTSPLITTHKHAPRCFSFLFYFTTRSSYTFSFLSFPFVLSLIYSVVLSPVQ